MSPSDAFVDSTISAMLSTALCSRNVPPVVVHVDEVEGVAVLEEGAVVLEEGAAPLRLSPDDTAVVSGGKDTDSLFFKSELTGWEATKAATSASAFAPALRFFEAETSEVSILLLLLLSSVLDLSTIVVSLGNGPDALFALPNPGEGVDAEFTPTGLKPVEPGLGLDHGVVHPVILSGEEKLKTLACWLLNLKGSDILAKGTLVS